MQKVDKPVPAEKEGKKLATKMKYKPDKAAPKDPVFSRLVTSFK